MTLMSTLMRISQHMTALGWSHGGGPGAKKWTTRGRCIGEHRDAVWTADMEDVVQRLQQEGGIEFEPRDHKQRSSDDA